MIKAMTRLLLATSATLVVVGAYALPTLLSPADEPLDTPGERYEREQRLRRMMELAAERIQAVDELLAGRKSLKETARRFRDLAFEDPLDVAGLLRLCHPTDCPENELFYRQVIYYTYTRVRSRNMNDLFLNELEAELERLRAAGNLTFEPSTPAPL